MNVDNQIIMHVKAGTLPPEKLLAAILAKKPTAFGYAVQNVYEKKPDLAITRDAVDGLKIEEVLSLLNGDAKDWPITLYFGMLKKGFNPEDIQPFVIQDGDGNDFISLFLEGTIVGHDEPKERTEQFNLVNGVLIPKILEWCDDFEGDIEKISAKFKGKVFRDDFMTHIGHRAILHVLPVTGDTVNLGTNEMGGEYDWGWTTQTLDFDKVVEQKETSASKPRFGFRGGTTAAATSVPASPPPKDTAVKNSNAVGSRPAQAQVTGAPVMAARPPAWVHRNEDVKLWYRIVHGETVAAWKKRIPVTIKDFDAVKIDNLQAFKEYALKKGLETTGGETETAAGKAPAATAKADQQMLSESIKDLPIINPKKMDKILEIAASLDSSSKEIMAPKNIQASEEVLAPFETCVGLERDESINWPVEQLEKIGEVDVMALVSYAVMWRSRYRALKSGQPEVKITETETSKTTTRKVGATTITESVSKEAPIAPAKKRFGFGSRAA
jgi:hypothetical protein